MKVDFDGPNGVSFLRSIGCTFFDYHAAGTEWLRDLSLVKSFAVMDYLFLSAVVIGQIESAYTVNEADEAGLSLCADLSDGILERSVTVMLNPIDGTANTMGK